ncbi:MAG TPA: glycosyltransferase family 39 protein [Bryobacteraceae bacterium]|nr:glycosyltransferase family 39 protein [Bryobacteraceae bacterium]
MKSRRPFALAACLALLGAWSAAAVWFFSERGWLLYYGDAEAHLNIARRLIDSQTPGYDQLGTVWLPLPHVLMLPLVRDDAWWRNGLAGAVPSAICFVVAGMFLFAAVRRVFDSTPAAAAATALFALNPNLMYLQSIPMTELAFFACLLALLYFTLRFRVTQGWGSVAGAGVACCLGTLTRYEAWFLIPFVSLYFLIAAKRNRLAAAVTFSVLAGLGPLYWLAHNWWLTGDALAFYRGPYSARTIQGSTPYPGRENWWLAAKYFLTAVRLCAGSPLAWIGALGVLGLIAGRTFWPALLLALPGIFYLWSMHSGATPIFVPDLWPHSYYNTRYGLAALPLLAVAAGGLLRVLPERARRLAGVLLVAGGAAYWAVSPGPENWITWKESQVNSESRRQWAREAADYLGPRFRPGSGLITSFGDMTAIYRQLGIPLRQTFTQDNGIPWDATVTRPDLLLWQEWAVVAGGDPVQSGINRAGRYGIRYRLEKSIVTKGAPVIEIYRRIGGGHGSA